MSDLPNPYQAPTASADVSSDTLVAAQDMQGTKTGLKLIYWGIIILLVVVVGSIVAGVSLAASFGSGRNDVPLRAMGIGVIAGGVGMVVGGLMMFIGQCFCLTVPKESGGWGLVLVSVLSQIANLVMSWTGNFLTMSDNSLGFVLSLFGTIIGIVGMFCFLHFLCKVAEYVGSDATIRRAKNLLSVAGFLLVMYFGFIGVTLLVGVAGRGPGGGAALSTLVVGIAGLVLVVVAIVCLCMYTTLLRNLIGDINHIQTRR